MTGIAVYVLVVTLTFMHQVKGHGRLIDPPARSSMWRFGFNTPVNTDDMALYCGGFNHQWNINGGRCGVCGDPYDGPRDHEAGGKYARGVIAKRYRRGETITVAVELTRSHLGWFEFRLCPNNDPTRAVTQECLDANLLRLADGTTRYKVTSWNSKIHHVTLHLPESVTCSQCVLQWKYNAGNSWGCTGHNTGCCVGCGHQEQFYGCADIAISGSGSGAGGSPQSPVSATFVNQNHNDASGNSNNNNYNGGNIGFIPISISRPSPQKVPASGSNAINYNNYNNNNNNNNNYNGNANNGGYIPINGYSPNNDRPGNGASGESLGISDYFSLMRCRGVIEAYTETCRKSCLSGYCPTSICSWECLALRH